MSKQFTELFPADIKPVHKGVYERDSVTGKYSFWNGKSWGIGFAYMTQVSQSKYASSHDQRSFWRGLSSDTSKGNV